MRVGRRLGKRDQNEAAIVQALRQRGIAVYFLSAKGFADLICYGPQIGLVLLEVKSQRGTLTKDQVKHTEDGWPVVVVRSAAEALTACGVAQ